MLIFDDESENDWNRQKVLERLSQVNAAQQPATADRHRLQPGRPDLLVHACTARIPKYDLMELKSLEDWVLEKQFKSVPNVVDVVSFGGTTREYQVRIDPDKLVSYGLSIGQVEQQLANNNTNAGGSFLEAGLQADQCSRGRPLSIRLTTLRRRSSRPRTEPPSASRTSPWSSRAPRSGWGESARRSTAPTATSIDNDDVVEGIVLLRKGADSDVHAGRHSQQGGRAQRRASCPPA